jgi:three-Cys-motif partner protein
LADSPPTTWEGKAHTFAKHEILTAYLKAWMPILSRHAQKRREKPERLLFIDGFAGPGVYDAGEKGSPLRVLDTVLEHDRDFPVPASFLFIESREDRFAKLDGLIAELKPRTDACPRIDRVVVKHGECDSVLNEGLDIYAKRGKPLGPALVFLDQFGYSGVPMSLVNRIMAEQSCEVLLYLNWKRMNPYLSDPNKGAPIGKAFGGDDWRPVLDLPQPQRGSFMLSTYERCLREKAGARYVWHFAMCDGGGSVIYWLFFCTNSLRGLEEMKRAMWTVDPSGGFKFTDRDDNLDQLLLLTELTDEALADHIATDLAGRPVTVEGVKEWVLVNTPYFKFKKALKILEKREVLTAVNPPPKRRTGSFGDDSMVLQIDAGSTE